MNIRLLKNSMCLYNDDYLTIQSKNVASCVISKEGKKIYVEEFVIYYILKIVEHLKNIFCELDQICISIQFN